MRNAIAKEIIKKATQNPNFILIAGDAGLGLWDEFQQTHKEQYLNPGINEAVSIGLAAGLALGGKKVLYYNIAPFVIMRPYEQVRNDIAYQELGVILVGIGCGLTYAPGGITHYAIEDIALALTMPNLQIFSPSDIFEAVACFEFAYKSEQPSYIRIPKAGDKNYHANSNLDIKKAQLLRQGKDTLLITHSNIISEVMDAGEALNASVASVPFINSQDDDILGLIEAYKNVFVVEEHFAYGGLGTLLKERLNLRKNSPKIHQIALPNRFIHKIGNQKFLREYFGLNASGIIRRVKELAE